MEHKAILVISDNEFILTEFVKLLKVEESLTIGREFNFACHPNNQQLSGKDIQGYSVQPLDIKANYQKVIDNYDLVISAHCKQLFPPELVAKRTCINLHPGYNPYNRGWYPQVFSILNGLPLGATIHLIDDKLDHGSIIDQEQTKLYAWDTSLTAYQRVQQVEIELLKRSLPNILANNYQARQPSESGNVNYKKDFEALQPIDLNETTTFEKAINRLRALSHPPFKNAYFIDSKTGSKVWVRIELEKEESQDV